MNFFINNIQTKEINSSSITRVTPSCVTPISTEVVTTPNYRKIYIFLLGIPFVNREGTGNAKTPGGEVEKSDGKKEDVLMRIKNKLTHCELFFEILFLVLTLEVMWDLTCYVLDESDKIIELSLSAIYYKTESYIMDFDPYQMILHAVLFIALILALYLMLSILNYSSIKLKKIPGAIIVFLIFDLLLCYSLRFGINTEDIEQEYKLLSTSVLLLVLLNYWVIESLGKIKDPRKIWRYIEFYMRKYHKIMGILFYSLFFYVIVCFFFTEMKETKTGNYAGVFILPGIAFLISGGFFICAIVIQRLARKNTEILRSLEVQVGENWKTVIKNLQNHISSLLAHFLVAISSYVFLKAILSNFLPEQLETSSEESTNFFLSTENVNIILSIILLIPLYLFFYRVVSATLEKIYKKIYTICEKPTGLIPYPRRRDYVVNIFVGLTKLFILILIIASVLSRFVVFKPAVSIILRRPFSYVLGTSIALPITIWLLTLLLDPFFEGETIEMGSHRGKIRKVGVFFTKVETMTGEQEYIPNAELLARTVRRLSAREPKEKRKEECKEIRGEAEKEKGIVTYFSCTLSYVYDPGEIENVFRSLFGKMCFEKESKEEKKDNFGKYLEDIRYKIPEEELEYIFSEESHPFVFIEELKDYGVVYRFNFRVRDSLYAPIFRGYFMRKFKEKMDKEGMPIVTPVKFEIKDIGRKEFRW